MAGGGAGCAGDRRPKLRAGHYGVERQSGRNPEHADLRHHLVPGLPGDPGGARDGDRPVVRGGSTDGGPGPPVQDRPADTVYSSTSDGRTYGNEDVFGSAPLPYLRPVVERDDGASPTSHWQVRIGFADLATFLSRAGGWPHGTSISAVSGDGSSVTLTDSGGAPHVIDGSSFRDAVNTWAPCLKPGRYPPEPLPITIPSGWMTAGSSGGAAIVTGRGWGHGVGMVQWGAYGKAMRGWSAAQILAYYYSGLRPQRYPEPGLIHVEVASGLLSLRLRASGAGATHRRPRARTRVARDHRW